MTSTTHDESDGVASTEVSAQRTDPRIVPRARGEIRRQEILRAAMTLFASGGFHSVSLADIAREVGITQAAIFHYFPNKSALLLAVMQQREEEGAARRQERKRAGMPGLEAFVSGLSENDLHPELVQLFVVLSAESTAPDHPAHDWFRARDLDVLERNIAEVRRAIDESTLPEGITAEVIARWLIAISHGLGAQWVVDPQAFDRAGYVRLFLTLLTPYLRDPGSAPAPSEEPTT
ncbi:MULTISPECIES: TetR/AcrR family transcriptional regulator [unclassified Microbacterium]|uniref:TetR/AcrR family transcriptional regulator n=1 Tax=unclassified Microbacterium TaxID=2609290 RepID=UPI00301AAA74